MGRYAMARAGEDPRRINPFCRVDFIVDHAVTAEYSGTQDAFAKNIALEFKANRERYELIKWAQREFCNFRVIPPGAGIVHQVNLEHLSRPIWSETSGEKRYAFPD